MGTFSYKEDPQTRFYVENADQNMFEITYPLYCELAETDGTHPLRVTQGVLRQLKKDKIITTSRWEFEGRRGRFILFAIGNRAKKIQGFVSFGQPDSSRHLDAYVFCRTGFSPQGNAGGW